MKLSIITINYNNLKGLRRTLDSISSQTSKDFENIIVDGGSQDGSLELIQEYKSSTDRQFIWISEPDTGIYNAMNKGIRMAKGDYIQFLNSGDMLAAPDITDHMLSQFKFSTSGESGGIEIIYGNMLKQLPKRIIRDRGFEGRIPTLLDFYTGTLNHSSAYIKRNLFKTYGHYDESLKIVSDWKWYLQVIAFKGVVPVYRNLDVTIFDMDGISNTNTILEKQERKQVLAEILPASFLSDYERLAYFNDQIIRVNKYWISRELFWLIERILFKYEKIKNNTKIKNENSIGNV